MPLRIAVFFCCLIHFQSRFDISAIKDGTRKSLCKWLYDVCQAIKMQIVLRYRFWVTILGKMYLTFLLLLSIYAINLGNQIYKQIKNKTYFAARLLTAVLSTPPSGRSLH